MGVPIKGLVRMNLVLDCCPWVNEKLIWIMLPRRASSSFIAYQSIEPIIGIVLFMLAIETALRTGTPVAWVVWLVMLTAIVLLPFLPLISLCLMVIYFPAWMLVGGSGPVMVVGGALLVYNWFAHHRSWRFVIAIVYPVTVLICWVYLDSSEGLLSNIFFCFGLSGVAVAAGIGAHRNFAREKALRFEGEQALRRMRLLAASDLHDNVAQTQALVVMRLRELLDDPLLPQGITSQVSDLLEMSNDATKELRSAMAALRDVDKEFGTIGQSDEGKSLTQQWIQLESVLKEDGFDPECRFEVGDINFSGELEHAACRILGELVTNIVWHGEPGPCRVELFTSRGDLVMRARNTITSSSVPRKEGGGQGLRGVEERVARLGGKCSFKSANSQWYAQVRLPIVS